MKKAILVLVGVVVFLGASVGTVLFLRTVISKGKDTLSSSTANEAIDKLSSSNIFDSKTYSSHPNSTFVLDYKPVGKKYSVSITTSKSLGYYATNQNSNQQSNIISQVRNYMQGEGFVDKGQVQKGSSKVDTFENLATVCQLITTTDTSIKNSYRIACISVIDAKKQYDKVDRLIGIYNQGQSPLSFTRANITTSTKENISYSILSLTNNNKTNSLLFAAVNNNWEYLGDITMNTDKIPNKYKINEELQEKISDPKYKGFITSEIH
jgi:uncharacterized membrane protein YheB (UPF0754 family)